ncbi:class I SAM-dependent methyltransferase [Brumimicrobium oceani]|uniref:SAM-dependent methyltransferase n=1 Tax=Brumimicrobium oceani TaxID=2100725 RepID=A0A2U2XHE3_9FLAO|nr:class I SAM-dependent methyltransferase [Brumimicrobium oceani]PWH87218.1 SAM-dependent methyltransferase [Brumimicrobium oceani]
MTEIWESIFRSNKEMWGLNPTPSTLIANDFFIEKGIKNILIPGFGYGRNAQVFIENGIKITGIEISKTAIEKSRKHFKADTKIYHGSVTEMPFDESTYDGIYSYALIHLLDSQARKKLIQDCYNQLEIGGYMIFVVVSKASPNYGTGNFISQDRYEVHNGLNLYFYDEESIENEFGAFGLLKIREIEEDLSFYMVISRKETI